VREILGDLDRWRKAGKQVAVARVVDSVSGGCVEGAVVTEALQIIESGDRRIVTFGYSDDEAFAVGLTCGGTIHLYIEPLDW
jgi:xanthine dehydrogenase accessory factor